MARRLRRDFEGGVYHVLNRRVGRARLFFKPGDYAAFEAVLAEVAGRFPDVRVLAYCLMPNHWHLVLWPRRAGLLSRYMQWVTTTHMRRWHAHRRSIGTGPVYQGRFKSFPVQTDGHLLVVCRYAERNPLRARLVRRAERWRWSSAAAGRDAAARPWLLGRDAWPVESPSDWVRWVNQPQTEKEEEAALTALRQSVTRGAPFGTDLWARRAATRLGLESSLRPIGRPTTKERAGKTPTGAKNEA
jgi:putative transposase